ARGGVLDGLEAAGRELHGAAAGSPAPGVKRVVVVPRAFRLGDYAASAGVSALAVAAQLFAILLLAFLLLASGDLYKRKLFDLAGPRLSDKKITLEALRHIEAQIERYL